METQSDLSWLKRPLVCFDLETTGLDPKTDRIVEIACVKIHPDGRQEPLHKRLNPQVPIPASASEVHGIYDADVQEAPTFAQLMPEILAFFSGCDLSGFNVLRFDIPLLQNEMKRAGATFPEPQVAIIDSQIIFHKKEPRNLVAALQFYCNKSLTNAHSASADASAAADVLLAQLEHYSDLPKNAAQLNDLCRPTSKSWIDEEGKLCWKDNEAILNFGKHRGKTLRYLAQHQADYLRWAAKADFPTPVTQILQQALSGQFPQRPTRAA